MKTLILANDCNPNWPSLPIVGYQMVKALSRNCEVTLATHVRNREALSEQFAATSPLEIEYIDNEYIAGPMYKLGTRIRGATSANWSAAIVTAYPSALAFD